MQHQHKAKEAKFVEQQAAKIRLLLLDVDGVLTDGRLYFSESGEDIKAFSAMDGHGIRMLMQAGIAVGIVTGRKSKIVSRRAAELGITLLLQGQTDKLAGVKQLCQQADVPLEQTCYVGDDLPDIPAMHAVGLALSVPGAHHDVQGAAISITHALPGVGAVREITDFLLRAQGRYPKDHTGPCKAG